MSSLQINKQGLNVLVVDDAQLVRSRVREVLNELPSVSKVFVADSFNEALKVLKKETLELALLDIQLPGKNGIELLKHIKKNYTRIKTIMLTNKSELSYKILCEKEGCDHFVDKSKDFEKIMDILELYSV